MFFKGLSLRGLSLKVRFLFIYGFGGVFFLFIITYFVFELLESTMEKHLKEQFQIDSHYRIKGLNRTFSSMTEQFQSASKVAMFRSMRFHQLTLNQSALKNDIRQIELYFQAFLHQKLPISQVRFVDKNGAEIFRVDKMGIQRNLSDMSQNQQIKEVLGLDLGQFKIITENNPNKVRNMTWWIPVYISKNDSYGVIGFSVEYQAILAIIRQLASTDSEQVCLYDAEANEFLSLQTQQSNAQRCSTKQERFWHFSDAIELPDVSWQIHLYIDSNKFLHEIKSIKFTVFGVVFPIVAMLAFLFSYLYSQRIITAIEMLVDAAKVMGRGETLKPINMSRDDELGELAKEMNASAKLIETNRNQLLEKNSDLDSYSYTLAHDLRSPLRSITSFSQILAEETAEKLNEEEIDFLRRIINASKRMSNLIDDILELSRISNRKVEVKELSLSKIANSVIKQLQETDKSRNVQIKITDNMNAKGDAQLLALVLENLLGNAWKYTSKVEAAEIHFTVSGSGADSIYSIHDNGVGFDMRFVHKIFKAFQRLHKSDEYEGTGIGLTSVKRMIERHEGRIWIESKIGQGTEVYFTLWTK